MPLPVSQLSALLPLITPMLPGVPNPVIEFQLRQAAIVACERLKCWRETVTMVMTANNADIAAPSYAQVHDIEKATWEGFDLTPAIFNDEDTEAMRGAAIEGRPSVFTQAVPDTITLIPYMNGTLRLSVILKPRQGQSFGADPNNPFSDAYNVVPTFMLNQYGGLLRKGAVARVCELPDAGAFDLNRAAFYEGQFQDDLSKLQSRTMRGQQKAPLRTASRWM